MDVRNTMKWMACAGIGAGLALATGCEPGNNNLPLASSPAGDAEAVTPRYSLQEEYDARLDEIESLAASGDVEATADATNSFYSDLKADIEAGRTESSAAESFSQQLQSILEGIDIDVHFGTDETCSATFNCVDGEDNCVSVTWKIEDHGGGRNCYTF